jgi:hypothetical protein
MGAPGKIKVRSLGQGRQHRCSGDEWSKSNKANEIEKNGYPAVCSVDENGLESDVERQKRN